VPRDAEDGRGLIAAWRTRPRVMVYLIESEEADMDQALQVVIEMTERV
jgi:hypothetical protein